MDGLLTTVEVAALLRVHPKQVYRLLRRGLPGHRVGGEWRFTAQEVLEWAANKRAEQRPGPANARAVQRDDAAVVAPPSILAANGDVVVELLLARLAQAGPPLLGLLQSDRDTALERLVRCEVLAAGCHGAKPPAHFGAERLARIHLVHRDVGLAAPPMRGVPPLSELGRVRIATRPPSAGVRTHLDTVLRVHDLDPAATQASALVLGSHRDVVLALVRGDADVGITTRAWAARAGLAFEPLATESYGLIVRAVDLGDPRLVRLCEVAQDEAFREQLEAQPGYDAREAGTIRYDSEGADPGTKYVEIAPGAPRKASTRRKPISRRSR